ncbi:MAG: HAD family phosphatase [Barnesiella sp.]|nr:HAD family phosphatase [Barnesiella sp.]MBD5258097.1 HAD family phosphatase [Barnesiella sp.]
MKNLMFDLGGVIMKIERRRAVEALQAIGLDNANEMLGEYGQHGIFLELELGNVTPQQWRDELRRHIKADVSDEAIDRAFEQFLVGIPTGRLRELEELHRDHKIYLLSNTNKVMWDGMILDEFRKDGHDINYYFDGVIPSFEVHCYKPDAEIFNKACEKFGIRPEETIFFDDSLANVQAAQALGFGGVHVEDERPFAEYLK